MENQITYSTLGTCVIRDVFDLCDKYKIFTHVRNNGAVSPAAYSNYNFYRTTGYILP